MALLSISASLANSIEIGQRIAIARDRTPVLAGDATIDVLDRGDVLMILNIRQDWVLLSRGHAGWVDRQAVLPVAEALTQLNAAVEHNPLDIGGRQGRSAIWVEQQFYDAAIAELGAAIQQDPRSVRTLQLRGAALRGKKAFVAAQVDADRIIGLAPTLPTGYAAAGDTWRARGFHMRAVAAYSQAVERDRGNADLLLRRGQARLATILPEQWNLALEDFREAIALAEHDPQCQRQSQLGRGQAFVQQDHIPRALLEYSDLLNRNPGDVAALIGRGSAYGHARNYERALSALNEAIYLDPKNARAMLARAEVRVWQYNLRGALSDVDEALELEPACADGYRVRAEALAKQRKWKPALEAMSEALTLEPNNAAFYVARARIYEAQKDTTKADADRQRAAAINSPAPEAAPVTVAAKDVLRR